MDAPPTDNDDTIADDTTAGTEAGPQNTPSQWQKHYVGLDQPLQPASPPRALPLCTYDEDETQIQFCSNVISQEVGSPMHHSKKSTIAARYTFVFNDVYNVDVMQLAEVELPLNKFDYELGDGESSNESEDLWAGGDATLEQQQQTSETSLHTQRADATSMADPLADAPEDPAATDTGNVDTEVEDNEGDDELATPATVKSPAPCPSPIINTDAAAECISSGSTKAQLIRIVLTGLDPAPLMRKVAVITFPMTKMPLSFSRSIVQIEAIQGAVFEEDVSLGTHLVAPTNELKRTLKMLCGISTCQHIVGEKWLTASAKQGRPVPEAPYCLHDPAKEAQWAFDLKSTMYHRHDRHLLFRGRVFYIVPHKTILPAPSDLTKIIECAGGEVLPTGSSSTAHDDGVIVIASAEALAVKSIRKKLGKLIDAPMHTPELILSGVLQQSLDLTKHRVGIQHSMAASKRKR
ncbi:hypothetical protein DYB32_007009 [Aphanomyces invadans]|uniref:BRCT domain-containing protein n=1 Tax=Aphanomyces invadans TaxID=157072 RepID=A0A418APP3_9STRA|nr:hypothetical protein DYB32_007009 [Aphanomyces invadans]